MAEQTAAPPLHSFWDRSLRFLLRRPGHLRALLGLRYGELVERLDFDRLVQINQSFIHDDYRRREADLVVRLPYRSSAGEGEVIVYMLLEHQSTVDAWMPSRLLSYMQAVWEDERRQQANPARHTPIIPAVLYTGTGAWRAARAFQELVTGPGDLLRFVPKFDILYLGLNETPGEALEAIGAFGWALRAVQRVEADHPEFAAVLRRAARALRTVLGEEWRELAEFLVRLVRHARPANERPELESVLREATTNAQQQTEVNGMFKTIAQVDMEKGSIEALRGVLLRQGTRRFGEPSQDQRTGLESITDIPRLESMSEAILDAADWDDLLRP